MRIWAWVVLALVAVVGFAVVGSQMADRSPSPAPRTAYVSPAPPQVYREKTSWGAAYHRHRHQFQSVAEYSQRARTERLVALAGFLVFVLFTVPLNAHGGRAFYRQLVGTKPLPPEAGDEEESNRRARQVLFFYLLFLLYQIVQFPLTWGRDNTVQFTSDLIFQFVLMTGVIATYFGLRRSMARQWTGDPDCRRKMSVALSKKVEGIAVRWRDMPRLAALMFVGGFTPALLTKLPSWLDVMSS